jgi:hypothetical protein
LGTYSLTIGINHPHLGSLFEGLDGWCDDLMLVDVRLTGNTYAPLRVVVITTAGREVNPRWGAFDRIAISILGRRLRLLLLESVG